MRSTKTSQRLEPRPRADLRILILNWRCPRNPRAGGAEALTFEVARRLATAGHSVEWFAASFPGAPTEETLDGVRVVRAGRQWTVHWHAFNHYRKSLRDRFDLVIDEVNTMPFFTPLWAGIPMVTLIFQLAREVWWYESPIPINVIGYALEPVYLRVYRDKPVITISKSTEQDLRKLGFRGPITIMPIGIEEVHSIQASKATTPTFLYVGRMAPSKRLGHMVRALAQFRRATGNGSLWLVGSGSEGYQRSLRQLARRLNVEQSVWFCGRVTDEEKHHLMTQANVLLMTSVREGWGLVVTEANACGTPAVVYDVPGLRDSVRNELTGLVVPPRPDSLCQAMIRVTSDPGLYDSLVAEGQRWSRTLSFDQSAQIVGQELARIHLERLGAQRVKD
jgi:glycosyltransferase involved in cell wall biosynthesis